MKQGLGPVEGKRRGVLDLIRRLQAQGVRSRAVADRDVADDGVGAGVLTQYQDAVADRCQAGVGVARVGKARTVIAQRPRPRFVDRTGAGDVRFDVDVARARAEHMLAVDQADLQPGVVDPVTPECLGRGRAVFNVGGDTQDIVLEPAGFDEMRRRPAEKHIEDGRAVVERHHQVRRCSTVKTHGVIVDGQNISRPVTRVVPGIMPRAAVPDARGGVGRAHDDRSAQLRLAAPHVGDNDFDGVAARTVVGKRPCRCAAGVGTGERGRPLAGDVVAVGIIARNRNREWRPDRSSRRRVPGRDGVAIAGEGAATDNHVEILVGRDAAAAEVGEVNVADAIRECLARLDRVVVLAAAGVNVHHYGLAACAALPIDDEPLPQEIVLAVLTDVVEVLRAVAEPELLGEVLARNANRAQVVGRIGVLLVEGVEANPPFAVGGDVGAPGDPAANPLLIRRRIVPSTAHEVIVGRLDFAGAKGFALVVRRPASRMTPAEGVAHLVQRRAACRALDPEVLPAHDRVRAQAGADQIVVADLVGRPDRVASGAGLGLSAGRQRAAAIVVVGGVLWHGEHFGGHRGDQVEFAI